MDSLYFATNIKSILGITVYIDIDGLCYEFNLIHIKLILYGFIRILLPDPLRKHRHVEVQNSTLKILKEWPSVHPHHASSHSSPWCSNISNVKWLEHWKKIIFNPFKIQLSFFPWTSSSPRSSEKNCLFWQLKKNTKQPEKAGSLFWILLFWGMLY